MTDTHPLAQGLTQKILIALAAGAILGVILNMTVPPDNWMRAVFVGDILDTIGTMFVRLAANAGCAIGAGVIGGRVLHINRPQKARPPGR